MPSTGFRESRRSQTKIAARVRRSRRISVTRNSKTRVSALRFAESATRQSRDRFCAGASARQLAAPHATASRSASSPIIPRAAAHAKPPKVESPRTHRRDYFQPRRPRRPHRPALALHPDESVRAQRNRGASRAILNDLHGAMDRFVTVFYRSPQQRLCLSAIYFQELGPGRRAGAQTVAAAIDKNSRAGRCAQRR